MASFVSFFKSVLFPSVKAQDDVVNPQEVLKVNTIDIIIHPNQNRISDKTSEVMSSFCIILHRISPFET